MDPDGTIEVPDRAILFVQKLEDLLREHNYELTGGADGDIVLISKSGHMIGWWQSEISVRGFRR